MLFFFSTLHFLVIAQTTIILRDVSIRIECELRLPGIDRASGLTLTIKHLSISNQYKTEEKQQSTPSNTSSSGRWSWLWWWQSSNNNNVRKILKRLPFYCIYTVNFV